MISRLVRPSGVRRATSWCAINQPTLILWLRAGCERMTSDDPPGLRPFGHAQEPKGLFWPARIIRHHPRQHLPKPCRLPIPSCRRPA